MFRRQTKIKTHMSLFAGKVILITGGTTGIGRATAIAFAEEGASVVVSGRREKEGEESVHLIEKASGKGLFLKADVAVETEIEALVARTVEHFGQLNFAFNNAGVALDGGVTDERMRSQLLALHPIGRFGHVEEVSSAVVYLCSPKSGFTTGIALPLDGGASA